MQTRRSVHVTGGMLATAGYLNDSSDVNGNGGAGPSFSSPAFTAGTAIPERYTCDGEDVSPPLELRGTPDKESLAFVVDEPDVPTDEPFVHWLVWNIPTDVEDIPEAIPCEPTVEALDGAAQGTNDFGQLGYSGPCPPTGDATHTYQFPIQLLDSSIELETGADAETFRSTVGPHVSGEATITSTYQR